MARYIITLKYKEQLYSYVDPTDYIGTDLWDSAYQVEYMYNEGNFSCDCNKSILVNRYCSNVDIPFLPCGDTVELVSIEKVKLR